MNIKLISRIIAMILLAESVLMLPSMFIAISDGDMKVAHSFMITIVLVAAIGLIVLKFVKNTRKDFYAQEGLVTTGLSWIVMSLFGALPFFISKQIPNYINAVFETVSGFTTTGASILGDVESLSRGILFWRSFTHWIGGMGMLVFLLAVIPVIGKNSGSNVYLLRAESPGPSPGKFTPKIHHTALILYGIYFALTFLCFCFLLAGGMPVFDSMCTAFGTAGTGGFGVKNTSLAGYSAYLQNVTTVFMLLFGVNFNIYYLLILRKFSSVFKDEELRAYIFLVFLSVVSISLNIYVSMPETYGTFRSALHEAAFQVSSIMTTTGFSTCDFDLWPSFSKSILLVLMCVGACAGSTGGGMKVIRISLLFKSIKRNTIKAIHPRQVWAIQVNERVVDEKIINGTHAYLSVYCSICLISFLLISLDGLTTGTNLSAVLACFNNIGPGIELVGASRNYSVYGAFSKIILSLDMLLGRLEIFPILLLFNFNTWKRHG
ncbi:MAG: TrkH family potassium uptake protein [Clostridiales bacterium]|nr:TrkH family potassium uptake protein [Clostridiales bacterium]